MDNTEINSVLPRKASDYFAVWEVSPHCPPHAGPRAHLHSITGLEGHKGYAAVTIIQTARTKFYGCLNAFERVLKKGANFNLTSWLGRKSCDLTLDDANGQVKRHCKVLKIAESFLFVSSTRL